MKSYNIDNYVRWKNDIEDKISKLPKVTNGDFIPCIFFPGSSEKVILHFHANGEDIG